MNIFRLSTIATIIISSGLALLMQPAGAAEHTLKIATVSPEGSYWMTRMRQGANEINERTDGRVQLKFYGGGVMGNDKKVMRKMRIGQLHGATFTAGGLSERAPNVQLYGMPLLMQSQEQVDYVRERMDPIFIERLEKAGLISSGFAGGGFARLMSNEPLASLDDLRGKKIWVPEGDDTSTVALEALGLAPVTLPITDVLTGLQTGLIDIIGASAVAAVVLQWHTKVRYVSDISVSYIYATLVIEESAFSKLDAADQAIVREVLEETYREFDRVNRADELQAAEALTKAGIETVSIDRSQVPVWREKVMEASREYARQSKLDATLLDKLESHLAAFAEQSLAGATAP